MLCTVNAYDHWKQKYDISKERYKGKRPQNKAYVYGYLVTKRGSGDIVGILNEYDDYSELTFVINETVELAQKVGQNMQRNKYLDDLGISIERYGTNFCDDTDQRSDAWKAQREVYGFDSRECWNLDRIFIEWLYSHLMMYVEDACIDMSYHKFKYNGKEYTQKGAIDYILSRLNRAIVSEDYNFYEVRNAIRMWAEIFPACWW